MSEKLQFVPINEVVANERDRLRIAIEFYVEHGLVKDGLENGADEDNASKKNEDAAFEALFTNPMLRSQIMDKLGISSSVFSDQFMEILNQIAREKNYVLLKDGQHFDF